MNFSWAMDLDPKGANSQIKDALDPTLNRAVQDDGVAGPAGSALTDAAATTGANPEESNQEEMATGGQGKKSTT